MKRFVIGTDFGTLSARTVMVNVKTGEEVSEAVYPYPHGVMDETLPSGKRLPPNFALRHPADYPEALSHNIPEALASAGASADEVAGICIDFTACTLIPLNGKGDLSFLFARENDVMKVLGNLKKEALQ